MNEKYHPTAERAPEITAPRSIEHGQASEHYKPSEQKESLEKARKETERVFLEQREHPKSRQEQEPVGAQTQMHISRQNRDEAYRKTMQYIQQELPKPARTFSKLIHSPAIEKASDLASATIARPNAILAGSVCAFLGVLGVYVFARYNGLALSGFESIAAFIIGWLLGTIYDVVRSLFNRR